jgi:hypothetical protein
VLLDITIAFPRVREPDVGSVDRGEVGDVGREGAGFGFESERERERER